MRIEQALPLKPHGQSGPVDQEDHKLRRACRDFESLLVYQLLTRMRAAIPKSDLFGSRRKQEIFQSMLDEAYAREIARRGTMKLGDLLCSQLATAQKSAKVLGQSVDK